MNDDHPPICDDDGNLVVLTEDGLVAALPDDEEIAIIQTLWRMIEDVESGKRDRILRYLVDRAEAVL